MPLCPAHDKPSPPHNEASIPATTSIDSVAATQPAASATVCTSEAKRDQATLDGELMALKKSAAELCKAKRSRLAIAQVTAVLEKIRVAPDSDAEIQCAEKDLHQTSRELLNGAGYRVMILSKERLAVTW